MAPGKQTTAPLYFPLLSVIESFTFYEHLVRGQKNRLKWQIHQDFSAGLRHLVCCLILNSFPCSHLVLKGILGDIRSVYLESLLIIRSPFPALYAHKCIDYFYLQIPNALLYFKQQEGAKHCIICTNLRGAEEIKRRLRLFPSVFQADQITQ